MKENTTKRTTTKKIVLPVVLLLVGFCVGLSFSLLRGPCDDSVYKYLNINLGCHDKPVVEKYSYIKLKNSLNDFIATAKNNKEVVDVGIYFRDLQNGPTLGINHDLPFSPASLLKLPVYLAYQNLKVTDPGLFDITLRAQDIGGDIQQHIAPKESVKEGQVYSIGELLRLMITYSDNQAYYILIHYLEQIHPEEDLVKQTLEGLGIVDPKGILDDAVSVKSYGSVFTQLYNSSYFSDKNISNEVLALLTTVHWDKGLIKGAPAGTVVAHKFGERYGEKGGIVQLHDCGIIYYPGNPYLLCVMTRGTDFDKLSGIISTISKMFYDEFDSRRI